jgi:3-oxoacyl-[acyl-carrier protein] reductase
MMRDINTAVSLRGGEPSDMLERIPLGRYGEAEEVARTIAWLLLDAPPFLTGAVLSVDGGMTIA